VAAIGKTGSPRQVVEQRDGWLVARSMARSAVIGDFDADLVSGAVDFGSALGLIARLLGHADQGTALDAVKTRERNPR
jgi:hypothetical protein